MVSAFPFDRLPRVARGSLAQTNAAARWLAARPDGRRVATLVGGKVEAMIGGVPLGDPHAARCELRVGGQTIGVRGASGFVRAFAQKLLGGPEELAAPRPLNEIEGAMWTLLVATAVEDLGIDGQVWPAPEGPPSTLPTPGRSRSTTASGFAPVGGAASASGLASASASGPESGSGSGSTIVIEARFAGAPCTIELDVPAGLAVAVQPARVPGWFDRVLVDAPIIAGRCQLEREDLGRLRPRSVITLERAAGDGARPVELVVLGGSLGLRADPTDPLVARVATEYVPRAMALPEDARVELTVGLGTARMSLRQVMGLAVGEVVPLGRALAGPFEIRAAGTLIGQGELVDVDGELGVRIVSLAQE